MLKECEICGQKFETTSKIRKYCDDCSKHTTRNRREVERGLRHINEITREPKVLDIVCDQCRKEFKTIWSCFIEWHDNNGKRYLFCSPKCQEEYIRFHATCNYCGKQFHGDYQGIYGGPLYGRYCDKTCIEAKRQEYIEENWTKCTCLHCGKEFYKKKPQKFCSKECYRAAIDNGWRTEKEKEREAMLLTVRGKCMNCGKPMEIRCTADEIDHAWFVCSDKCNKEYREKLNQKARQKKREEKMRKEKESKERTNFPLCATCKVPYTDCCYMQTGYVNLPRGAHMDSTGKIVKCPNYR